MRAPRVARVARVPRIVLLLAAGLLAAGGLAAAWANQGPGNLVVNEVHFLADPSRGGNVSVDAVLYLTSRDHATPDVRVEVYFYPRAGGMAGDRQDVGVGTVEGQRTAEVRVPLVLPANATSDWAIDFLVFEHGLLTQRGQGHVGYRGPVYEDAAGGAASIQASAGPFEKVR